MYRINIYYIFIILFITNNSYGPTVSFAHSKKQKTRQKKGLFHSLILVHAVSEHQ